MNIVKNISFKGFMWGRGQGRPVKPASISSFLTISEGRCPLIKVDTDMYKLRPLRYAGRSTITSVTKVTNSSWTLQNIFYESPNTLHKFDRRICRSARCNNSRFWNSITLHRDKWKILFFRYLCIFERLEFHCSSFLFFSVTGAWNYN